jgi:hypothetical protein
MSDVDEFKRLEPEFLALARRIFGLRKQDGRVRLSLRHQNVAAIFSAKPRDLFAVRNVQPDTVP